MKNCVKIRVILFKSEKNVVTIPNSTIGRFSYHPIYALWAIKNKCKTTTIQCHS